MWTAVVRRDLNGMPQEVDGLTVAPHALHGKTGPSPRLRVPGLEFRRAPEESNGAFEAAFVLLDRSQDKKDRGGIRLETLGAARRALSHTQQGLVAGSSVFEQVRIGQIG